MVYQWKAGSHRSGSAQAAGEVCAELESRGCLNAQTLVDVSRPASAPTHGMFEWNDSVAAEEFRKYQARLIIRSIVVVEENSKTKEQRKVFYNISTEGGTYTHINTIIRQKDRYDQLLADALAEIHAFKRKYRELVELNTLFDAIDNLPEPA